MLQQIKGGKVTILNFKCPRKGNNTSKESEMKQFWQVF